MKYLSFRSPLKMIWVCKSKNCYRFWNKFFNPLGILGTKKTIKITTSHGNGPKVTVSRFHPPDNNLIGLTQIQDLYKFDYVNYPSKFSENVIGKRIHVLPNKKIINFGYPRCDNYFNKSLVRDALTKKEISKSFSSYITKESKIILYTPTWRPYDYKFPLLLMEDDLHSLNEWLKVRNYFLFFSVHTAQQPKNIPKSFKNIIHIKGDIPFYDTNKFMLEVDVLLNDYSTTSTDIAILDRPQLFYMPDYDEYSNESGFVEDYRYNLPGKEIYSMSELKSNLEYILSDDYDNSIYSSNRKDLLSKYYDHQGNSCDQFYVFLKDIINI